MRGNAKYLNTKADYEYVRQNQSNWKDYYQELYDSRLTWFTGGSVGGGVEDETHKISKSQTETMRPIIIQKELRLNPNCKLLRIGYTVSQVEKILSEG